jgi:hypothetical protein
MSTWRPPWSAQGQFKLTLLPPTWASNSVTARRPPGPVGGRAARAPVGPSPSGHAHPAQPPHPARHERRTRAGVNRPDTTTRRGMAKPRRVCPAWAGEQSKHGDAEKQWQTPRRRRRTDGARLRRNPNVRRGRLHRPALPVQPRSALRDPPRLGSAEGNSAAATPPLSCRGPMVNSTRSPHLTARIRQQGASAAAPALRAPWRPCSSPNRASAGGRRTRPDHRRGSRAASR